MNLISKYYDGYDINYDLEDIGIIKFKTPSKCNFCVVILESLPNSKSIFVELVLLDGKPLLNEVFKIFKTAYFILKDYIYKKNIEKIILQIYDEYDKANKKLNIFKKFIDENNFDYFIEEKTYIDSKMLNINILLIKNKLHT